MTIPRQRVAELATSLGLKLIITHDSPMGVFGSIHTDKGYLFGGMIEPENTLLDKLLAYRLGKEEGA